MSETPNDKDPALPKNPESQAALADATEMAAEEETPSENPPETAADPPPPVAPKQSIAPVAPKQSIAPGAPKQSIAPGAPKQSIAPVAPKQSIAPVAPKQSIAPVAPKQSIAPAPPPDPSRQSIAPAPPPDPSRQSIAPAPPPDPSRQSIAPAPPPDPSRQSIAPASPPEPPRQSIAPASPPEPPRQSIAPASPPEPPRQSIAPALLPEPPRQSIAPASPPDASNQYVADAALPAGIKQSVEALQQSVEGLKQSVDALKQSFGAAGPPSTQPVAYSTQPTAVANNATLGNSETAAGAGLLLDDEKWKLEPHPDGLPSGAGGAVGSSNAAGATPATPAGIGVGPEGSEIYKERFNFGDYVNWTAEKKQQQPTTMGTSDPNQTQPGQASETSTSPGATGMPPTQPGQLPTGLPPCQPTEGSASLTQQPNQAVVTGGSMDGEDTLWKLERDPNQLKEITDANSNAAANPGQQQPCGGGPNDPSSAAAALGMGQTPGAILAEGSNAYEDQPWVLEKDPAQLGQVGVYEYSMKDSSGGCAQTQTDADGNLFHNHKGSDCMPKSSGACEGCTHAVDQCFPNQTECIDLEYTQLVGVAQDFADVAQGLFQETRQLGWYIVAQCLQFMDDDICDPCACRNATTDPIADADGGEAAIGNGNDTCKGEASKTEGSKTETPQTDFAKGGSIVGEDGGWQLEKDPSQLGESASPEQSSSDGATTKEGEEKEEFLNDAPEGEEPTLSKEPSQLPLDSTSPSSSDVTDGEKLAKEPSQTTATAPAEGGKLAKQPSKLTATAPKDGGKLAKEPSKLTATAPKDGGKLAKEPSQMTATAPAAEETKASPSSTDAPSSSAEEVPIADETSKTEVKSSPSDAPPSS